MSMNRLAAGTIVKKYVSEDKFWVTGKIVKWDEKKRVYITEYTNPPRTEEYVESIALELAILATIQKGSRVSIYSYGEDSFYGAVIRDVDDSKLENFQADFDSGLVEWIDLRRFKFYVSDSTDPNIPTSSAASNMSAIESFNGSQGRAETLKERTHPQELDVAATLATETNMENTVTARRSTSNPKLRAINDLGEPAPSSIMYVERGTIIAIRWKRPYILYDATVVKMKEDGSQYLLQYHYDSCTKWVDLNKSEFYVIGLNSTFHPDGQDAGPTRAQRRSRKSDEPSADHRKRRKLAVPKEDTQPVVEDEGFIQPVNEREVSAFQIKSVERLEVGSRIAIWRNKGYRKATVHAFDDAHEEFEILYDSDKQSRKIHLRQNPFLILSSNGDDYHNEAATEIIQNHQNPDVKLVNVGTRVSVLWEGEGSFFSGSITKKRNGEDPFFLSYDDGESEWIDLAAHTFKIEES